MNQLGGSTIDTLVKLVLIFFISLLSFSVGTFVGKEFSDKQHRLASVESDYESENASNDKNKNLDSSPEEAMTDEDIAKLSDEFIKEGEQTVDAKHAMENTQERQVASNDKNNKNDKKELNKESIIQDTAQRISHNQTPTEPKKESGERSPTSLPALLSSSTIGKYTVQVASYSTQQEAEEYAQNMKSKGFSAFVIPAEIQGKNWYRVSVGLYTTRDEAMAFRKRLIKQANLTSAIVQKIGQY